MPNVDIDYSNTLFYKIYCKDTNVTELYIGHTTNFVQRKSGHKQSCNSSKAANRDCKLYHFIRDNGGWENWRMDIIAYQECNDHYEARKKEQELFILYKATLNSIEPMPRPKPPREHANDLNPIKAAIRATSKYQCVECDYCTSRLSLYDAHNLTRKHRLTTQGLPKNNPEYNCDCGKTFSCRQNVYRHKKICNVIVTPIIAPQPVPQQLPPNFDAALVIELLKQNQEVKDLLIEQSRQIAEIIQNNSIL